MLMCLNTIFLQLKGAPHAQPQGFSAYPRHLTLEYCFDNSFAMSKIDV